MNLRRKKIAIIGNVGQAWSVDMDYLYSRKAIKELNYKIVKNILFADIIYCVWYSYLLKTKLLPLRFLKSKKKIIAVATNDLKDNNKNLRKYGQLIDYWVCANQKQKKFLLEHNYKVEQIFINPFYVDTDTFKPLNKTKKELIKSLKLNYNLFTDKVVISSFQRDSRGDDLKKSKWHKNPELLVEVLKKLDKTKYIFLLAGPRRHFIINECKKNNIPYVFVGNEKLINEAKDDINENNISLSKINILYNLSDLYLVTSASEGGPKAIIESMLTKTAIFSTAVGFAPEFLESSLICNNINEFLEKINNFISSKETYMKVIERNFIKVNQINNFDDYKKRLSKIIEVAIED